MQQVNVDIKLLSRHQIDLTKERTRFKNKLHKLLLSYFPEIFDLYKDPFSPNCLALLALGKTLAELFENENQTISRCQTQVKQERHGRAQGAQKLKKSLEQTVPVLIGGNRIQSMVAADYAHRIHELNQAINRLDQELAGLLSQHPCGSAGFSTGRLSPITAPSELFSQTHCHELSEAEADARKAFARKKVWSKRWFGRVTLDMDSTVESVCGEQEGAAKGYNPQNPGHKSYHPLLCFIAETRECLHNWFRTGSAYSANGSV